MSFWLICKTFSIAWKGHHFSRLNYPTSSLDGAEHRKAFDFQISRLIEDLDIGTPLVALLTKLVTQQRKCDAHEQESDNNAKESRCTAL
jgi:hypothetical protein